MADSRILGAGTGLEGIAAAGAELTAGAETVSFGAAPASGGMLLPGPLNMEFIEPQRPGRARLLLAPTLSNANIACCGQYLQAARGTAQSGHLQD